MRIALMGSGRVAHHLAQALARQHTISHVCSRNIEHARILAQQVGAKPCQTAADLDGSLDLIVVAVSDAAIVEVVQALHAQRPEDLVVHTSGSTALAAIATIHPRAGVLYPVQTFSLQSQINWRDTPLLLEACDAEDLCLLQTVATALSERVYVYDSAQRLSLHLAAVFACNFANYCYDMAAQVVGAQAVDFALLHPLMLQTASKATQHLPREVQTGPAARGDAHTMALHETLLAQAGVEQADLLAAYQLLSAGIVKRQQHS